MHWGYGVGGWGHLLMALNMVVFWGLLITAVVLLVRYLTGGRARAFPVTLADAERVLAERYARSEIDDEEYQRRLAVLRGAGRPSG